MLNGIYQLPWAKDSFRKCIKYLAGRSSLKYVLPSASFFQLVYRMFLAVAFM